MTQDIGTQEPPEPLQPQARRDRAAGDARGWLLPSGSGIIKLGVLLALLYAGRGVLIPLALAVMLGLLVAPAVRWLRRAGLGRHASVLLTVLLLAAVLALAAATLGAQVVRLAQGFSQYEATIRGKLGALDDLAFGQLREFGHLAGQLTDAPPPGGGGAGSAIAGRNASPRPALAASAPTAEPAAAARNLAVDGLSSLWAPLQTTGIVVLVLIFVLLEHESLRDRFIRLAGVADIRATTLALADAGERLSRYFVSQAAVNAGFGIAIWLALSLAHLPEPLLFGAMAALLRFIPYVGVAIAGLLAALLALAVDPGWTLAATTIGVFVVLDIAVGQVIEPHLYGHATGLSPLSVVVAAIFWSAIWGPAGLLLSTPLTLCLVVAGHHVESLRVLELLLSDAEPLTLPQRFYQRALSGDPHEILASARDFLRRASFADYCDRVVIPALHLARLDADTGATTEGQHARIRSVIVDVVARLSDEPGIRRGRSKRRSVLEDMSAGRILRRQRELLSGRWQGPLGVAPGSVVITLGVGSSADDLAAELLVRLLRSQGFDARHFSPAELDAGLPRGADPDGVSIVYIVSAFPGPERDDADAIARQVKALLPGSLVESVLFPGITALPELDATGVAATRRLHSFGQAIQMCISWRESRHGGRVEVAPARDPA
ncbi:MAG: AI-2E family transporter [Proteobacteria bacterium]|nr:AI-2E family transporter [Pseudomonadota bacterium]